MKCSQEGLALIKKFEGCRLESYRCSANVLTIGENESTNFPGSTFEIFRFQVLDIC